MFGMLPNHVRDASRFSTKRRKHGVQAMSRAQAHFQEFWVVSGTRCSGHIRDKLRPRQAMSGTRPGQVGTQPDFQAFLGSLWARCAGQVQDASWRQQRCRLIFRHFKAVFWDSVCRPSLGHVMATIRTQPDFQAISRPCPGRSLIFKYFKVVSGSRCAGHVQDAFEPWRGWSLIFRNFRAIFGHSVQAISETRPDRGHGVKAVSKSSRDGASFSGISRPRPERLLATVGVQLDFQAFVGNLWATSGTPPCRSRGHCLIFRHLKAILGYGVQAMFGTRPGCGHVRDASWPRQGWRLIFRHFFAVSRSRCAGHLQDATGTLPEFLVFFGSFWNTVCKQCSGCIWATTGMQPGFQAFLGHVRDVSGLRSCQGHVRTTAGMELDFQVIPSSFWGWCAGHVRDASWPGNVRDVATMQPDFQAFLGNFLDTVCWPCQAHQAMSEKRLSHGRDAAWFSGISRQFLGHGVQAMSRML
ncbi:Hypothetical predicted protein [Olea europaea subsp. europaea]|uniref:Uncharacterized protein n=1 Tax=Olea europaea subsp. europaea TaxID=158383 RepID=A0A8S0PRG5_OLEEU|nr:Hypothetical predicted protein [Olea europaea subsp. europaea]